MSKERRKFTPADRLSIVQESLREGVTATSRKYSISPALLDRLKKKYLEKGVSVLKDTYYRVDPQVRQLEEENARLCNIIANQAFELEVKSELLKNIYMNKVKVETVNRLINRGSVTQLSFWTGLAKSVYYYKPKDVRPGMKPSGFT